MSISATAEELLGSTVSTLRSAVLLSLTVVGYNVSVCANTVTAHFSSGTDIPVVAAGYTATGNDVDLSLGFAPETGTDLMVVENTGLPFISGQFTNLAHGTEIGLNYNGIVYRFVANYFGGSGNDLVLHWQHQGLCSLGSNQYGQLGDNSTQDRSVSVGVVDAAALQGKTVISFSCGRTHCLAVCSDGTVVAWGNGSGGRLGDSNFSGDVTPFPVKVSMSGALSGKTVVSVSAGGSQSLALCSDGSLATWGPSEVPVLVDASGVLSGKCVVAISAGGAHNLALCSDGTLVAWGWNGYGQLGDNSTVSSSVPVLVDTSGVLSGKSVVSIATGAGHCLILCSDGTLAAWGNNDNGELGNGNVVSSKVPVLVKTNGVLAGLTVSSITCGDHHSLALTAEGSIAAWGYGNSGQLGNNGSTSASVPMLVVATGVLSGKTINSIAAGANHSVAVCNDGRIAAWGGITGFGLRSSRVPVLLPESGALIGRKSKTVDGGGEAYGDFGPGEFAISLAAIPPGDKLSNLEIGEANLWPRFSQGIRSYSAGVSPATGMVHVKPVARDASLIKVNGTNVVSGTSSVAIPIHEGTNAISVEVIGSGGVGSMYTVTVNTTTTVNAAFATENDVPIADDGARLSGLELSLSLGFPPPTGTNLTLLRKSGLSPISGSFRNLQHGQLVELPYNGKSYRFAANYYGGSGNDLVLEWAARSLASWGSNSSGQLGNGGLVSSNVPVAAGGSGVLQGKTLVSISSSASSTLALCTDGTVAAWGGNLDGQLGTGTTIDSGIPVPVEGMGILRGKHVISVATGNVTSLALCSDSTLAVWGSNYFGQFGNGNTANSNEPLSVTVNSALAGKTVVSIVVGGVHCLALCSDGTMVKWGADLKNVSSFGSVPTVVSPSGALVGKSVTAVAAGMYHCLALCSDGSLVAWGDNSYGQLGDNGQATKLSPPVEVDRTGVLAGKTIVSISSSSFSNLVLCSDGTMAAWGSGGAGQLGNGLFVDSKVPVLVDASGVLTGKAVVSATVGDGCAFSICSDGSAASWGLNGYGQLGDGTSSNFKSQPGLVNSSGELYGKKVLAISSGGYFGHSHAILAVPASGYIVWASGDDGLNDKTEPADPDLDGIPNLMEYILSGNPSAASNAVLPTSSRSGGDFVFSFNRLASSADDTTQFFQYSVDMKHWTDIRISSPTDAGVLFGAVDGNGMQSVTVTLPGVSNPSLFARLRVTRP